MGEVPMDGMAVADLGLVFVQLTEPEKFTGKEIGLTTCKLTVVEYAAVIARCTRKAVRDAQMSLESYKKLDFPGSQELAHMFHFYHVGPARDTALTLASTQWPRHLKSGWQIIKQLLRTCNRRRAWDKTQCTQDQSDFSHHPYFQKHHR